MKKGINKSILFYIASVLFFIASAIGFTSGNESSMAIVWLCLGSSFLCLIFVTAISPQAPPLFPLCPLGMRSPSRLRGVLSG